MSTTQKEMQLGFALAKLYIAAQDCSPEASEAACTLIMTMNAAAKLAFDETIKKDGRYQVSALRDKLILSPRK